MAGSCQHLVFHNEKGLHKFVTHFYEKSIGRVNSMNNVVKVYQKVPQA